MPRFPTSRHAVSIWAAAAAVAVLAGGCAKGGAPRVPLGDAEERIIGARLVALARLENRSGSDPTVTGYIQALGSRMARLSDRPAIPYTFEVIADPSPRAFVLPGGYVYLSTGLLAKLESQAELAGVLGHALAHHSANHPMSRLLEVMGRSGVEAILMSPREGEVTPATRRGLETLLAGYPREQERAADRQALLYVTRVGLNPEGFVRAMEKVDAASGNAGVFWEGASSSAAEHGKRILGLRAEVKAIGLDAGLPFEREPYAPIRARAR